MNGTSSIKSAHLFHMWKKCGKNGQMWSEMDKGAANMDRGSTYTYERHILHMCPKN